jgi:hypothetical protein
LSILTHLGSPILTRLDLPILNHLGLPIHNHQSLGYSEFIVSIIGLGHTISPTLIFYFYPARSAFSYLVILSVAEESRRNAPYYPSLTKRVAVPKNEGLTGDFFKNIERNPQSRQNLFRFKAILQVKSPYLLRKFFLFPKSFSILFGNPIFGLTAPLLKGHGLPYLLNQPQLESVDAG